MAIAAMPTAAYLGDAGLSGGVRVCITSVRRFDASAIPTTGKACGHRFLVAFLVVGKFYCLMHSVAGIVIFYGIGFGWYGHVSLTVALAGCVAFYALQIVLSRVWLSAAQFGPVEWLWRMFTYPATGRSPTGCRIRARRWGEYWRKGCLSRRMLATAAR